MDSIRRLVTFLRQDSPIISLLQEWGRQRAGWRAGRADRELGWRAGRADGELGWRAGRADGEAGVESRQGRELGWRAGRADRELGWRAGRAGCCGRRLQDPPRDPCQELSVCDGTWWKVVVGADWRE